MRPGDSDKMSDSETQINEPARGAASIKARCCHSINCRFRQRKMPSQHPLPCKEKRLFCSLQLQRAAKKHNALLQQIRPQAAREPHPTGHKGLSRGGGNGSSSLGRLLERGGRRRRAEAGGVVGAQAAATEAAVCGACWRGALAAAVDG